MAGRRQQGRSRVRLEDPIPEMEQEQQSLLSDDAGRPRPTIVPAGAVGRSPQRPSGARQPPPLQRSTSTPYSRYAASNDALEEMDKVFGDTEREVFKTLVKADEPEPKLPKRYSEDDFQGHFKENQFARPHDVLKHGKKKKKSHGSAADAKDGAAGDTAISIPEEQQAESVGAEAPTEPPPATPSTDEPSTPPVTDEAPSAEPAAPKSTGLADAPVVDQRAAYVPDSDETDVTNRVKFEVGPDEDVEEDSRPGSAQGMRDPEGQRHRRHHHHHHHHRQHVSEQPAGGAAGGKPDNGQLRIDDINSHRYESKGGHRRHKVTRKKDDKTISNVVHLGDVNTGQTMLLGKKTYDHTPHDMFVEMDELMATEKDLEWQETARWIKYEEDVEQGGNRWGRPHLAALSFLSLMNLRRCLERGALLLDVEEHDSVAISHRIATQLVTEDQIQQQDFGSVMRTLLLRRQHVGDHQGGLGLRNHFQSRNLSKLTMQSLADMRNSSHRSLSEMEKKDNSQPSMAGMAGNLSRQNSVGGESMTAEQELHRFLAHQSILRRMAPGTEVFSVNVGRVDWATKPVAAFVRLAEGTFLPGITEMPLPVRFIFFLVGPNDSEEDLHETGRAFATLMSSPSFHEAAYKAESRSDLMWAFKEFLDDTLVLPPIDWTANPDVLDVRELQQRSRDIQDRKRAKMDLEERMSELPGAAAAGGLPRRGSANLQNADQGDPIMPPDDPLIRQGRPFAGFIRDVKRRYPWYLSDFKDGVNGAVLSSAFFIFFAALAGAITFGGLMMDKTKLEIGISETIISTAISGVVFALFSCQPLIIVGTTGPVLLFDEALYQFANSNGLEFLPMRVWIAIWMLLISLIVVALEGSVLVRKFTRFTTEIFSSLVSILFIFESLSKLATVFNTHPLLANYCDEPLFLGSLHLIAAELGLDFSNGTEMADNSTVTGAENATDAAMGNATSAPTDAPLLEPHYQPNTALLSLLLMFGTFAIANYLRHFRNSKFLGRRVRRMLGDFGVPIAILLMVGVDLLVPQVYTQHLQVPPGLTPSNPALRDWFISPLGLHERTSWVAIVGALPAAGLIFIVIYMETMVCELIMAKPERNLQKGTGFHFDIVLLSALNLMCSLIGAPWMCAATIRSVSHAAALTVLSTNYAPGEKPAVVGVHEQRLSALIVSVLLGLSVVLSSVLKQIPVAVVFGVFMYMGVSSMTGVQMLERVVLFLKPVKHHDKAGYVKRVRTWRMHLFTVIQLICLGFLLGIKFTPAAIGFPFFLAMLIPLRLLVLPKIFTEAEINALDGDGADDDDEEDADFYEEAHTMPSHTSTANLFINSSLQLLRVHSNLVGAKV
ncbi:band 3 anion transport protein-like isoform X1 [Amphibalanus amphitrite]|uniref:band 3 anion transport protein-like isoform X1 n=1 Tax=Amphibalanus amphitrite TaxID=1232801 RepID=UPI001C8FD4F1|nr:band 3 anion transport protein-like isoform X1 [Amphibalanus amphitrite]